MSIHQNIGNRYIDLSALDGVTEAGPTIGIYCGAGGDIVVVLAQDPLSLQTTFVGTSPGGWLPISIKKWVSGPVGSVGVA